MGKLWLLVFGILCYIIDVVDEIDGFEVYLVLILIVYDQLYEVEVMIIEVYGVVK